MKVTENVAQVFMGMRIQCAQCHNHPFDRWTMDDYYGFACVLHARSAARTRDDPRELIVFNAGGGEVNHPVKGRPMKPKFLGGAEPDVAGKDRREVLADWLASRRTTRTSPRTSRTSSGPTSSGRASSTTWTTCAFSNPASNQPNCSTNSARSSPTTTTTSRNWSGTSARVAAYQRDTIANEANETDSRNFAHGPIRRIRAETMLDIITQVTETKNKFPGLPLGARAVQIADGKVEHVLPHAPSAGPTRETVCSCEVRLEPTLSQSLHLMNGNTVGPKMQQGNLVGKMLQEKKPVPQIIEMIYVRCLSRSPTPDEYKTLTALVEAEKDKKQALEDIFWSVLNSREFLFNH